VDASTGSRVFIGSVHRGMRRTLPQVLAVLLTLGFAVATESPAAAAAPNDAESPDERSVDVSPLRARKPAQSTMKPWSPAQVRWPAASSSVVSLAAPTATGRPGARASASGGPVSVAGVQTETAGVVWPSP
jgi:hypothetical protein